MSSVKGIPPTHNGRIKYADPKDLPSYPSRGLPADAAAAGAAATLGWNSQKSVEPWRPEKTHPASVAAMHAKDYKLPLPWEPETDTAGRKAALLAVGSAGVAVKHHASSKSIDDGWGNSAATQAFHARRPATAGVAVKHHASSKSVDDGWGNSAATQAFHARRPATAAPVNLGHGNAAAMQAFNTNKALPIKTAELTPVNTGERSLAAAKGAMSSTHRIRSTSSPVPFQRDTVASLATGNTHALDGATLAHRASIKPLPHNEAGAVPVTTMTRDMFTSHPAFRFENEEVDANERIHQTAVVMAKKMYNQQQKMLDQAKAAHAEDEEVSAPGSYLSLQDAAYKQAQERLAKLHDEHQRNREMQEYYGNASSPKTSPKRRFSIANKLRRRSSSDGEWDDRERSEKIRNEMSMFSSKLSQVDKSKRDSDREALMAVAQRNVTARLQGMDQKGNSDRSQVKDWELKARETAQARSEVRNEHKGMIDLGGGKFISPEEVNAIAAQRLQPWLDEVDEKVAAEHERQAVLKLEEENRKEQALKDKSREKEWKDIEKQLKDEQKQETKLKRQQEREEEKARKNEEKAAKLEEKRQAKDVKRTSKSGANDLGASELAQEQQPAEETTAQGAEDETHETSALDDEDGREEVSQIQDEEEAGPAPTDESAKPTSSDAPPRPTLTSEGEGEASGTNLARSPTSKVRGWIRNRFSRGKSMSEERKRGSFMGGASLKSGTNESTASVEDRQSSIRDVALAGRGKDREDEADETRHEAEGVSPLVSDDDDDNDEEEFMDPPLIIKDPATRTSQSPNRDSRFREEISN